MPRRGMVRVREQYCSYQPLHAQFVRMACHAMQYHQQVGDILPKDTQWQHDPPHMSQIQCRETEQQALFTTMASPEHTYDVIVLGAGISGLYTARCLAEEGIDVLVLEARDRVGGRAWTRRDEQYDYVDMGGAYYGKQQTRVLGLAKELGLKTYNVPFEGHMIMYYKGVRHKYLEGGIPLGDIFAAMDANNILQTIDEYSKQFPIDAPWKAERAGEWDSMNVRQFLEQEAWTSASKFLIGQGFSIVFGKDAECVSFLYALLLVRLCGGVRALFGSIKGLQEKKIIGGSNSISEKMAEKLGGKVVLKSVVKSIHQDENGVTLTTEQNKVYKARHIVIAFSPNLYKFVNFTPQLPQEIKESVQFEDDYHDLKTITYYPKAYWREKGFRGEFVSDSGPIGYALDDTKYDGQHPAIIGFVTDLECFYLPEDKRKERIANWYSQVFGIEELKNPIGYIEKNWGDEDGKRFAGDCVHTFPPGQLTKLRRLFGKPFDRVHFAGVETALTFRGYMDGGVRSGDRVTKEILDAMGKQAKRNYETVPEEIPYLAPDMLERFLFSIPQLLYLLAALVAVLAINVAWFKYGFL